MPKTRARRRYPAAAVAALNYVEAIRFAEIDEAQRKAMKFPGRPRPTCTSTPTGRPPPRVREQRLETLSDR